MSLGSDGTRQDGPPLDAQTRAAIEYFIRQLEQRFFPLLVRQEPTAGPPAADEYVTSTEMAKRLGISTRQFKRAYTEGPLRNALRGLAIKRGVKAWRWPVRKTLSAFKGN